MVLETLRVGFSRIDLLHKIKEVIRDPRTEELTQKASVMRGCLERMLGDSRNWSFSLYASQTRELLGSHWNDVPAVVKIGKTTKGFTLEIIQLHDIEGSGERLELIGDDPRVIKINRFEGKKKRSYQIAPDSYDLTGEKIGIFDRWIGIGTKLEAFQKDPLTRNV